MTSDAEEDDFEGSEDLIGCSQDDEDESVESDQSEREEPGSH